MAQGDNIFGIESLEIGAPGDGVMGVSLSSYTDIEKGSLTLDGAESSENTIQTEGNDSYVTLNADVTPTTLNVRVYGIPVADYPMLMGGSVAGSKWSQPASVENIFLSIRLTSKALGGKQAIIEMAYCKVVARVQGTVTSDGLPAIAINATANTPISAAQVAGDPVTIEFASV